MVYLAAFWDALAGRPAEGKGILSLLLLIALPIVDLLLSRALHAAMAARAETGAATADQAPAGAATSLRAGGAQGDPYRGGSSPAC